MGLTAVSGNIVAVLVPESQQTAAGVAAKVMISKLKDICNSG
jgi:hypothetical protein